MRHPIQNNPSRQWPAPDRPWTMRQMWHDLLFMHWPVPVKTMRRLVPDALPVDTFDGWAWVGVVPFRMSGVRPRWTPPVPWLSAFPELNVRTYVTLNGKPGVYFFSLDAANPIAVWTARLWFNLPYYTARMSCERYRDVIAYESERTHPRAAPAHLVARYRSIGNALPFESGSIVDFFTSRYCLYVVDRHGRPRRREIDHVLWPLTPAEAEIEVNTMTQGIDLALPRTPPLLHVSERLEVVVWSEHQLASPNGDASSP